MRYKSVTKEKRTAKFSVLSNKFINLFFDHMNYHIAHKRAVFSRLFEDFTFVFLHTDCKN